MRREILHSAFIGFIAGVLLPTFVVGTFEAAFDLGGISRDAYWEKYPEFYGPVLAPGGFLQECLGIDANSTNAHRRWFDPYVELGMNWLGWSMLVLLVAGVWRWIGRSRGLLPDLAIQGKSGSVLGRWVGPFLLSGLIGVVVPVSLVGMQIILSGQSVSELNELGSLALAGILTLPGRVLSTLSGCQVQIVPFASPERFWRAFLGMLAGNWIGWLGILLGLRGAVHWITSPKTK